MNAEILAAQLRADRAEREGVPCLQMRGGSSKGAFFAAADLPAETSVRDDLLLRIMGSPDERQVDGIGGAHPLTSKIAVISPSEHPDADVDYLFLQVLPDSDKVATTQTCGNMLAAVAPFALERCMVAPTRPTTEVRIRIVNPTESFATATVETPDGRPTYHGHTTMAGAPFPAAPIPLTFPGARGAIFPTGHVVEQLAGLEVTCVDAGMPVVVVDAAALGLDGSETPTELEQDHALRRRIEDLRLAAGPVMGLGKVAEQTVPKVTIVSAPRQGGTLTTRTFIPHRVHAAVGVLGAVSVAAAALTPGTVAARLAPATSSTDTKPGELPRRVSVEHPTGTFEIDIAVDLDGSRTRLRHSTVIRTARKLADGRVWPRPGRRH